MEFTGLKLPRLKLSGHATTKWGCNCDGTTKEKRANWFVVNRNCNYSAFESPKYGKHWSERSGVICVNCGRQWRTKADYVLSLPDCDFETAHAEVRERNADQYTIKKRFE
jgi:hypothetical protein